MNITVEVEAKAKESAVKKLMEQLSGEKLWGMQMISKENRKIILDAAAL